MVHRHSNNSSGGAFGIATHANKFRNWWLWTLMHVFTLSQPNGCQCIPIRGVESCLTLKLDQQTLARYKKQARNSGRTYRLHHRLMSPRRLGDKFVTNGNRTCVKVHQTQSNWSHCRTTWCKTSSLADKLPTRCQTMTGPCGTSEWKVEQSVTWDSANINLTPTSTKVQTCWKLMTSAYCVPICCFYANSTTRCWYQPNSCPRQCETSPKHMTNSRVDCGKGLAHSNNKLTGRISIKLKGKTGQILRQLNKVSISDIMMFSEILLSERCHYCLYWPWSKWQKIWIRIKVS